jgi:hypothetical protein
MKTISVRLEEELWLKAKQKMLLDGESFQGIFIKAVEEYIALPLPEKKPAK